MTFPEDVGMNKDEAKAAMKEAIKEWMDDQLITLGKWTIGAFLVGLVGALTYMILIANGWQHKG